MGKQAIMTFFGYIVGGLGAWRMCTWEMSTNEVYEVGMEADDELGWLPRPLVVVVLGSCLLFWNGALCSLEVHEGWHP